MVYIKQFFNESVLDDEKRYYLADESLQQYYVPDDQKDGKDQQKSKDKVSGFNMPFFKERIGEMPTEDDPLAFGQHINAQISSQIAATNQLLSSILSLQPKASVSSTGETVEQTVAKFIPRILEKLPEEIDETDTQAKIAAQIG